MPEVLSAPRAVPPTSRATVIMQEIARLIEAHRLILDGAVDLGEFTVTVKLHAGTTAVKSSTCSQERVNRRVDYR